MHQALLILKHAFAMIFNNPGATVRAIAPGLALIVGPWLALLLLAPEIAQAMMERGTTEISVQTAGQILIGMAVMFWGLVLMVIIWHRFVLLAGPDRDAGLAPSFGIILGYIWRSILLGLIAMAIGFAVFLLAGLIMAALSATPIAPLVGLISGFLSVALISWALTRFSLVLPAIAIGKRMEIGESWELTGPVSGTVFWLAVGLSLVNVVFTLLVGLVVTDSLLVSGLAQMVSSVVVTLLGASVLTTLYGILVEGRVLGDTP